ncbi:MAG TPA: nicotinate-nucleotide--dimethylbenzimidazole phosphoribosyltransferase [Bryobacteraceae bacterium]|nr:nicotinate-nucleotide--dimethylbenzimidazole phosphoribosyltransferase [Bryobacteraceae bacterium]
MRFPINIPPPAGEEVSHAVTARWDSLTKPPGSLGYLEELVLRLALATDTPRPTVARKAMAIFCADHGVTAEGISAFPKEVTVQMAANFVRGGAAIHVLCQQFGIAPYVVDAGVDGDPIAGTIDMRLGRGTANFAVQPAMDIATAVQALHNGAGLARQLRASCDIAAVGEMGIGNTTSASALFCAYAGAAPGDAVGPGAGVDAAGVARKAEVIRRALALHEGVRDPVEILAALGGFEIATMAGFLLGAASLRLPVVVDGFISSAAALAAYTISPGVLPYLLFSHVAAEPAHRRLLGAMGARPILDLDMRLGEGSGAAMAMPVLDGALALYNRMATFAEGGVSNR